MANASSPAVLTQRPRPVSKQESSRQTARGEKRPPGRQGQRSTWAPHRQQLRLGGPRAHRGPPMDLGCSVHGRGGADGARHCLGCSRGPAADAHPRALHVPSLPRACCSSHPRTRSRHRAWPEDLDRRRSRNRHCSTRARARGEELATAEQPQHSGAKRCAPLEPPAAAIPPAAAQADGHRAARPAAAALSTLHSHSPAVTPLLFLAFLPAGSVGEFRASSRCAWRMGGRRSSCFLPPFSSTAQARHVGSPQPRGMASAWRGRDPPTDILQ